MGTANVNLLVGAFMVFINLPVVQWTEQKVSNLLMGVRFPPGGQMNKVNLNTRRESNGKGVGKTGVFPPAWPNHFCEAKARGGKVPSQRDGLKPLGFKAHSDRSRRSSEIPSGGTTLCSYLGFLFRSSQRFFLALWWRCINCHQRKALIELPLRFGLFLYPPSCHLFFSILIFR